jgi:hypothetical protein
MLYSKVQCITVICIGCAIKDYSDFLCHKSVNGSSELLFLEMIQVALVQLTFFVSLGCIAFSKNDTIEHYKCK